MAEPPAPDRRLHDLRERWEQDRSSRLFLQLAEEHRRRGQAAEALAVLDEGLRSHPGYLSAQVAKGRCQLDLGDPEGARATLGGVLRSDPTHLLACKLLVRSCVELEDVAGAMSALDRYRLLGAPTAEVEELESWLATARTGPRQATTAAPRDGESAPAAAAVAAGSMPEPSGASDLAPREQPTSPEAAPVEPFALPRRERPSLRLVRPGAAAAEAREFAGGDGEAPLALLPVDRRRRQLRRGLEAGGLFVVAREPAVEEAEQVPGAGEAAALAPQAEQPAAGPEPSVAEPPPAPEPVRRVSSGVWSGGAWAAPPPAGHGRGDESEEPEPEAAAAWAQEVAEEPEEGLAAEPASERGEEAVGEPIPEPLTESAVEPIPEQVAAPVEEPAAEPATAFEAPAAEVEAPAAAWQPAEDAEPATALPAAPEAVAEPAPLQPAASAAAPSRSPSPGSAAGPTATLGDLYLRQGYLGEAERIFREVLRHEPDNAQASRGLESVLQHRGSELTAADLLGEEGARERGVTARKMLVLKRYLDVLRGGTAGHVSRTTR